MHITHINSDHVFSIIKISIKVCIFSQIFKRKIKSSQSSLTHWDNNLCINCCYTNNIFAICFPQ